MSISMQNTCIAAIGTITITLKAQHALASLGIASEVQALSPTETKRGCAYGLSFPCELRSSVQRALLKAQLPISQIFKRNSLP